MKSNSEYQFFRAMGKYFPGQQFPTETVRFIPFENYDKESENDDVFCVYEDWWVRKSSVVLSKINSMLGKNKRIFARKTQVRRIDKDQADKFLNSYHIYGTTKSKHKYGLFSGEELLSVATFSAQRNLDVGRSSELIRYCTKNNVTVVGGLDKIIKHYEREMSPNHIMTYIDLDWGRGDAFRKIGFSATETKEPITYWVNSHTGERSRLPLENHIKVKNKGSLKMERFYKSIQ